MPSEMTREEAEAALAREQQIASVAWCDDIAAQYGGEAVAEKHPVSLRRYRGEVEQAALTLRLLITAARAAGAAEERARECVWSYRVDTDIEDFHLPTWTDCKDNDYSMRPDHCCSCGGRVRVEEDGDATDLEQHEGAEAS